MRGLMRRIEELAIAEGATRVSAVSVRVGALANMTPEHFREHFDAAARGTLAAGARCEVELAEDLEDADAQHVVLVSVDVEAPA